MNIPIYQVDAFAGQVFEGNPAAVCPLNEWLPEKVMQQIAMENNLSETAFFAREGEGYRLRWFTPSTEVDLCGHATLASAHVLFEHLQFSGELLRFFTNSGKLLVRRKADMLEMDFPASSLNPVKDAPPALRKALQLDAVEVFQATDYLYVLENEQQVARVQPDLALLGRINTRGVIITAPGEEVDFVSRFFGPAVGVDEDPVTGSAHTMLAPYWGRRLNKKKLVGRQISQRGGTIYCHHRNNRVALRGSARTFLQGEITL